MASDVDVQIAKALEGLEVKVGAELIRYREAIEAPLNERIAKLEAKLAILELRVQCEELISRGMIDAAEAVERQIKAESLRNTAGAPR